MKKTNEATGFRVYVCLPLLDEVLDSYREVLRGQYHSYRNHAYRVANFGLALSEDRPESREKVSLAAAFHDLAIWTHATLDYLTPSIELLGTHLSATGRTAWTPEISEMIANHHKLTPLGPESRFPLVEAFRRADWVDVTRGIWSADLAKNLRDEIFEAFPDEGFHQQLASLLARRWASHPLRPLPMLRL